MTMTVPEMPETLAPTEPARTCRECRWSECRFRVTKVRTYLIAYREALKHNDDPADYIRDCVRPSRDRAEVIEPWIRGASGDPHASLDIKLSLELARDQGGLALTAHNAQAVATWLCERAGEEPLVSED